MRLDDLPGGAPSADAQQKSGASDDPLANLLGGLLGGAQGGGDAGEGNDGER
jgi:hypothetical protein